MSAVIRFEEIFKVYRLGEARRSFREAFSGASRRLFSPRATDAKKHLLWALKNVTFEVERGEAYGIIGPNGAGKTTILKLLSKITQPTSGRITVDGRVSALIELGAGFHPDLTGRENIYLNAVILGLRLKEVKRLFDEIVDFSGLERFIDTPVKRYSSGMYVRLGFSVAAHVNPDVLLVDEVLAVGDSQFRQRCAQRIEDLKNVGTTIVFVSHNVHLVRSICSRGIFLASGQSQMQGDVVDIIDAYETYLHQAQIDEPASKLLDGEDPSKSSVVEITRVEIHSLNKESGDRLRYTDAAEVRVHFLAREPVPKPNLVVRIVRSDGTICCMIRTADYGHKLDDLDGQGVVSLTIDPLQLAEGVYVVDARIVSVLDGAPLAIHHSRGFQVAGPSVGHGESGGVFAPHVAGVRVEQEGKSYPLTDAPVGKGRLL